MKHLDGLSGTKGLYLAISPTSGGEPRIIGLTCRHVVISLGEGPATYDSRKVGPIKEVIQVDQSTYEAELQGALSLSKSIPSKISRTAVALAQRMEPYISSSSRVFAQVLYAPELQIKSQNNGFWLRDWALLELLTQHHEAQLGPLQNKVFLGDPWKINKIIGQATKDMRGLQDTSEMETAIDGFTLKL